MLTENLNRTKVAVAVTEVKPGDTVYISDTENSVPYFVLDVGSPFILIENTKTHFASLYRAVKLFKEQ